MKVIEFSPIRFGVTGGLLGYVSQNIYYIHNTSFRLCCHGWCAGVTLLPRVMEMETFRVLRMADRALLAGYPRYIHFYFRSMEQVTNMIVTAVISDSVVLMYRFHLSQCTYNKHFTTRLWLRLRYETSIVNSMPCMGYTNGVPWFIGHQYIENWLYFGIYSCCSSNTPLHS